MKGVGRRIIEGNPTCRKHASTMDDAGAGLSGFRRAADNAPIADMLRPGAVAAR